MSMLIKYTNGTDEVRYFHTKEAFRWFLGVQALENDVKVLGYKKLNL